MMLPMFSNNILFKLSTRRLPLRPLLSSLPECDCTSMGGRSISTTFPMEAKSIGRFKVSRRHDNPITYEESFKPSDIGHIKYWNSLNNSSFPDFGLRRNRALTEDVFIRRFMICTWHRIVVSEVLIKRQANLIRIACIVQRTITARKMYFLIGYTEELLSHWLQCPIKLELQTVQDKKDIIFKYV